jgi:hypothetical protein
MIYDPHLGLIFIKTLKVSGSSFEVAMGPLLSRLAIATISSQWTSRGGPPDALRFRRTNWLQLRHLFPQMIRHGKEAGSIFADLLKRRGPRHEVFSLQKEHWSAEAIREFVGIDEWNRCIKIEIARNPYDRLVSNYFMKKGLSSSTSKFPTFRDWLVSDPSVIVKNEHLVSVPDANGVMHAEIDLILYYENMEESLTTLSKCFGFDSAQLIGRYKATRIHDGFRPKGRQGSVEHVVDADSKLLIDTLLKMRFDRLGYLQDTTEVSPLQRSHLLREGGFPRPIAS